MSLRTGLAAAVITTILAHMPLPATAAMPTPGIATALSPTEGLVLQVHSRKRVHDALHAYGYDRVTHRRTRYDYDDRPVYVFSACRGHKRFRLVVNWYGELIRKRRTGFCRPHYY